MVKQAVKVLIRTRPTANFASKNIQINEDKGVSFSFILESDSHDPEECRARSRQ